jgi:hypothetical protein
MSSHASAQTAAPATELTMVCEDNWDGRRSMKTLHSMLIDAVRLWLGSWSQCSGISDDYEVDPPSTDCDDGEEHFETALISVATLFTVQVSQCFFFFLRRLRNILCLFVCFFIWKHV